MIELKTASQLLASTIKDRIVRGELALGQRLHIRDLARELGVSTTPVREALSRLVGEGLVKLLPRIGIFVTDPTEKDLRDLFQARLCLELGMAEAVVDKASRQQIEILRELAEVTRSRDFKKEGFTELTFHQYFAELSGNPHLGRLREQVNSILRIYFVKYISSAGDIALAQHAREEEAICQALESRGVRALKEAVEVHIRSLQELVLRAYRAEGLGQAQPRDDRSSRE